MTPLTHFLESISAVKKSKKEAKLERSLGDAISVCVNTEINLIFLFLVSRTCNDFEHVYCNGWSQNWNARYNRRRSNHKI